MQPPAPVFPLSAGGAAHGLALPAGALSVSDLTALPRFGLKGAGSAAWLEAAGAPVPGINALADWRGLRLLRLGREDLLVLGDKGGDLAALRGDWEATTGPRGWSSWREEGWAWFRLEGPALAEAMARLCALDLRPAAFGSAAIAQTRVGGIEAVLLRTGPAFDVLFDITLTATMARILAEATHDLTGGRS